MKKISTVMAKKIEKNASQKKLTIGLDLGDRFSWYCVLNEAGEVILEQKVATTPKAMKEVFGGMPRSRMALETGTHSPHRSAVADDFQESDLRAGSSKTATPRGNGVPS
jgi:transposase